MWFKNLQIFRVPRNWDLTANDLAAQLKQHSFQPAGSFALESRDAFGILRERFRKTFNRDAPSEPGIRRRINLTHATRAQMAGDLVVCEFAADHEVGP